MRVPATINEDNFPIENIVYVYGGMFDPRDGDAFCGQIFPSIATDELLVKEAALKAVESDFSAELYQVNKTTGEATRITHRLNADIFPETFTAAYLKEAHNYLGLTSKQVFLAFAKYESGSRPGDDGWSIEDQEVLDKIAADKSDDLAE